MLTRDVEEICPYCFLLSSALYSMKRVQDVVKLSAQINDTMKQAPLFVNFCKLLNANQYSNVNKEVRQLRAAR